MNCRDLFMLATVAALSGCAAGALQPDRAAAVSAHHPLVGRWKLEIPNVACDGMMEINADGTSRTTSAAQVVDAEIALTAQPAESGYYTLTEKITKENGQANCVGKKIEVGRTGSTYVILNSANDAFLMCVKEDINTCVGPFARQPVRTGR